MRRSFCPSNPLPIPNLHFQRAGTRILLGVSLSCIVEALRGFGGEKFELDSSSLASWKPKLFRTSILARRAGQHLTATGPLTVFPSILTSTSILRFADRLLHDCSADSHNVMTDSQTGMYRKTWQMGDRCRLIRFIYPPLFISVNKHSARPSLNGESSQSFRSHFPNLQRPQRHRSPAHNPKPLTNPDPN